MAHLSDSRVLLGKLFFSETKEDVVSSHAKDMQIRAIPFGPYEEQSYSVQRQKWTNPWHKDEATTSDFKRPKREGLGFTTYAHFSKG